MTQTEKILEKLIAYPTVSRDSHLAMIQYLESCLGEYGIKSNLTFNDEKTKANLSAVFGPWSMEQGHKPDEYILKSELERCDQFLSGLLVRLTETAS